MCDVQYFTYVRSQDDSLSLGEGNLLALGKESGTNLGSLGVEQDGCRRTGRSKGKYVRGRLGSH